MINGFFKALRRGFRRPPTVAVVRLQGVIGAGGRFNRGLEDGALAPLIQRAFTARRPAAVALAINSPGGSPAQSSLIAARIRDFADETQTPVFAFCEDVAASGGYWLACAADEIYADRSSVLGSIGVISASFGFVDSMKRLGVERRLQTAGDVKSRLDPFSPLKEADQRWLAQLQNDLHRNFIETVRQARGDRLSDPVDPELFSGEVFLGEAAVRNGLIDGIGRLRPVMRERFGPDVRFEKIEPRRGFLSRFAPGAETGPASTPGGLEPAALAAAAGEGLIGALEARALWARYGL